MAIEVKTERRVVETVVGRTITCDILFCPITQDDIAFSDSRWVASYQAVKRLPEEMRPVPFLRIITRGCGSKKEGFTPELLHDGWWLLFGDGMCFFDHCFPRHHQFAVVGHDTSKEKVAFKDVPCCETRFQGFADVVNFVEAKGITELPYYVFWHGRLHRTLKWGVVTEN